MLETIFLQILFVMLVVLEEFSNFSLLRMNVRPPEADQKIIEDVKVELLELSFDDLPEGFNTYVPWDTSKFMVTFGYYELGAGVLEWPNIQPYCSGVFVSDEWVLSTNSCCTMVRNIYANSWFSLSNANPYVLYAVTGMSTSGFFGQTFLHPASLVSRPYYIKLDFTNTSNEASVFGNTATESTESQTCFLRLSEKPKTGYYDTSPWHRLKGTYDDLDTCNIFTWYHDGGEGIFRLRGRFLDAKTCKRLATTPLTKFQSCVKIMNRDVPCNLWSGGPIFCDTEDEMGVFVGLVTDPQNEEGYYCKSVDRVIIFDRIDLLSKFYCSVIKDCEEDDKNKLTDEEKEKKKQAMKPDTTLPDPYGEGEYVTGKSGEYKLPEETNMNADAEEEGDGLPLTEYDDVGEDLQPDSEEGGLHVYQDRDPDDTDIVAPSSSEYLDVEEGGGGGGAGGGKPGNIGASDDPNYPESPSGQSFVDPDKESNDTHYLEAEGLAPGVNPHYYDHPQPTVNLKPWIDFIDDALATEQSNDYGDSPGSILYTTMAEQYLYFDAGVNYDMVTPTLPVPLDDNVNTVDDATLAQVALMNSQVIPMYAGDSSQKGIPSAIPGFPYDKRYPSTPPPLPPQKIGRPGHPPVEADGFWNDAGNVFQPAYGGAAKAQVQPMDVNSYVHGAYEFPALGPDRDVSGRRGLHTPLKEKKIKNVTNSRRDLLDALKFEFDEKHGALVGAYGEGGPANPVADAGIHGFPRLSPRLPSFTGENATVVFAEGIVNPGSSGPTVGHPSPWQPWNNVLGAEFDMDYVDKDDDVPNDIFQLQYANGEFQESEDNVFGTYSTNCVYITVMVIHAILFTVIVIACLAIVAVMVHKYREKVLIKQQMEEQKAEEEARLKAEEQAQNELKLKLARKKAKEAAMARRAERNLDQVAEENEVGGKEKPD